MAARRLQRALLLLFVETPSSGRSGRHNSPEAMASDHDAAALLLSR